jgi:hypothetical protein
MYARGDMKMYFRERGRVVQIIRTSYDKGSKVGKSEVIGKLKKAKLGISPELEAKLTAKERKEVAAWLEGYSDIERLKRDLAVRTLPEQLAFAEEWFKDHKGDDARFLAASLVPAWARLRAALKKLALLE